MATIKQLETEVAILKANNERMRGNYYKTLAHREGERAARAEQALQPGKGGDPWKKRFSIASCACAALFALCLGLLVFGYRVAPPSSVTVKLEPSFQHAPHDPLAPRIDHAQSDVTPQHVLASVKMVNGGTRCSATVISQGRQGAAILSAAHCVAGHIGGEATFVNPNGSKFKATLVAFDRRLDLSLFRAEWRILLGAPMIDTLGQSWVPHEFPVKPSKYEAVGYTAGGAVQYKTCHPEEGGYHVDSGPFAGGDLSLIHI